MQPSDDEDDYATGGRRGDRSAADGLPRPPISGDGSRKTQIEEGARRSRHDLENKTDMASQRFRDRRDGYESDEGDTLRDDRRGGRDYRPDEARPRERKRGDADDETGSGSARNGGGKSRRAPDDGYDGRDPRDVEPRGGDRPRRDVPDRTRAPPVQYGNDPVGPSGRGGGGDYDDDARGGPRRAASQRERRPPRGYAPADYDDDDYDRPPPRRNASQRDPRREGGRRPPAYEEDYDGYKSDRNGRRNGGPRYDDYYSDGNHARGGNRPPAYYDDYDRPRRRDTRDDPRDSRGPRDDGYGRDPRDRRSGDPRRGGGGGGGRYRDDYDDYDRRGGRGGDRRDDPRDKGGKKGNGDIMAALGPAFTAYAMPMIKKEGGKVSPTLRRTFSEVDTHMNECADKFVVPEEADARLHVEARTIKTLSTDGIHNDGVTADADTIRRHSPREVCRQITDQNPHRFRRWR